jgi:hypothetical protein
MHLIAVITFSELARQVQRIVRALALELEVGN